MKKSKKKCPKLELHPQDKDGYGYRGHTELFQHFSYRESSQGASALLHIIDMMGGGGGLLEQIISTCLRGAPRGESQHPVILSRKPVPLTTECVIFLKCQCVFSIHLQKNIKNHSWLCTSGNARIFNKVMRKSFLIFLYASALDNIPGSCSLYS